MTSWVELVRFNVALDTQYVISETIGMTMKYRWTKTFFSENSNEYTVRDVYCATHISSDNESSKKDLKN